MSETVENWVGRLKPRTGEAARFYVGAFMAWVEEHGGSFKAYTPDRLVEYQRNADNGHRYDVLDLIQRYILSMKARKSSKMTRYSYLKSYFAHNRADLPVDKSFKIRGDEPIVRGNLSVDEARKIILSCDPMYQAVYLSMLQGGMGSNELLYWSNHGLEKLRSDLRGDPEVVKVELPGRKSMENERPYYTFLGGDAITALKKWLSLRDATTALKKSPEGSDAIFVSQRGDPLTYNALQTNWRRQMRRIGIGPRKLSKNGGRTGKSPHELRDVFRTQWAKSPSNPEVAEFMMGHTIDLLDYNKVWRDEGLYRAEYLKALQYLQIMSSGKPFHQVAEEEVEGLRANVEELREENKALQERLERIEQQRGESDAIMDRLFKDEKFIASLKERLKAIT